MSKVKDKEYKRDCFAYSDGGCTAVSTDSVRWYSPTHCADCPFYKTWDTVRTEQRRAVERLEVLGVLRACIERYGVRPDGLSEAAAYKAELSEELSKRASRPILQSTPIRRIYRLYAEMVPDGDISDLDSDGDVGDDMDLFRASRIIGKITDADGRGGKVMKNETQILTEFTEREYGGVTELPTAAIHSEIQARVRRRIDLIPREVDYLPLIGVCRAYWIDGWGRGEAMKEFGVAPATFGRMAVYTARILCIYNKRKQE